MKLTIRVRGAFKKYREFWISASYIYSIFDFFVALCWYLCLLLMPTSTAILNVQLIFDSCLACTCFGSSSIFAYSKNWMKKYLSNFVWKTKLSARTHSECWLWHMVKLPWTDATFMTCVSAKFVPKLLNFDQKQHRINIAQEILESVAATVFLRSGPLWPAPCSRNWRGPWKDDPTLRLRR